MNRRFTVLLSLALALLRCGCGAVSNVRRTATDAQATGPVPWHIRRAMDVVCLHFLLHFDGCTLTELTYDADFNARYAPANAAQYGADEALVLLSTFQVGEGDGSLNPNSTYRRFQWVLTRSGLGPWRLRTWGYG